MVTLPAVALSVTAPVVAMVPAPLRVTEEPRTPIAGVANVVRLPTEPAASAPVTMTLPVDWMVIAPPLLVSVPPD
jgi:hypothetical protein